MSPTLPPEKASEVAKAIVKRGPRRNKRRVSLIITPEESFVMDTTYRVSQCIYSVVRRFCKYRLRSEFILYSFFCWACSVV